MHLIYIFFAMYVLNARYPFGLFLNFSSFFSSLWIMGDFSFLFRLLLGYFHWKLSGEPPIAGHSLDPYFFLFASLFC